MHFSLQVSQSKHSPTFCCVSQSVTVLAVQCTAVHFIIPEAQLLTSWFATVPRSSNRVICVLSSAYLGLNGLVASWDSGQWLLAVRFSLVFLISQFTP